MNFKAAKEILDKNIEHIVISEGFARLDGEFIKEEIEAILSIMKSGQSYE